MSTSRMRRRAAENDAASAKASAEAAYYRQVEKVQATIIGGVPNSGGYPGRIDTGWRTGERYYGEVRDQSPEQLEQLRARARSLEQYNVLASAVLDRACENVVGTTVRIEPRSSSPAWNDAARAWWKSWAHSTACDIRERNSFGALLRMAYRSKLRDGDCLIVLASQNGFPKLQLVEGDRLASPFGVRSQVFPNGNRIDHGIEYDSVGRDVRYFVRNFPFPGESQYQPIQARDAIFLHRANRVSGLRGESAFQGSFTLFDQIAGYLEAVVVAARVGASQAMIAHRKNPASALSALNKQTTITGEQQSVYPISPGQINVLGVGEDLMAFNPSQPQQNFPDAIAAFARFVGLRFGLTLEQVLLDFSRCNYSSSRAARLQADATATVEVDDLAIVAVSRIYRWAISTAVKTGQIKVPPPPDTADMWAHEWIPQSRPPVDPLKDVTAAKLAVGMGIDTRSNIAMGLGYDFHDLCQQNARDLASMRAANIPIEDDSTGDPTSIAGKAEADAYGVAARASLVTPNLSDEQYFRSKYGLPKASPEVMASWTRDGGTRKPITITNAPDDAAPASAPPAENSPVQPNGGDDGN